MKTLAALWRILSQQIGTRRNLHDRTAMVADLRAQVARMDRALAEVVHSLRDARLTGAREESP